MFRRIEHNEGSRRPFLVLLILVGILAITVAVQVSRFAGTAGANSEPPSAPSLVPSPTDPTPSDPGPNGTPPVGSGVTPEVTPQAPATTTPSGSPTPLDPGVPYTISGTIRPPLRPGGAAVPIDVAFSNANVANGGSGSADVRISSLEVSITSVTGPNINGSRPCSAQDFALTQFGGTYPFSIPTGASSLSSLGFASSTWPTLRMKESGTNQNGCKGATVTLAYTGAP